MTVLNDNTEVLDAVPAALPVEQMVRGEIDIQIKTAKTYPRSIQKFRNETRELACLDEETASECFYALKRSGKTIPGPSVRFAEIIASCWGNCRATAQVIEEGDKFVTSQGSFFDLERNAAVGFQVKRRITDRNGRRYNDDMVMTTSNAASAIAFRNAVLRGIPKAFWLPIYNEARMTATGDAQSIADKRMKLVEFFGKIGVELERILAAVGVPEIDKVGPDELLALKSIASSIKNREITIDQAFPVVVDPDAPKAEQLKNKIGKAKIRRNPAPKVETIEKPASPEPKPEPEPDYESGRPRFQHLIEQLAETTGQQLAACEDALGKWSRKMYQGQGLHQLDENRLNDLALHIIKSDIQVASV
jgi:hypothetical protein